MTAVPAKVLVAPKPLRQTHPRVASTRTNPTLKQIAEKLGLTIAAVSMALRSDPSIPPETRTRVRRTAERLGYRPDPELAKLMSYLRQRRRMRVGSVLGLLTLRPERPLRKGNNFMRRLQQGIVSRANDFGYDTEEFWLGAPDMTPARMRNILVARGVQALIVLDAPTWMKSLDFDLAPFSAVTISYAIEVPLHRVCQHQYQEMFLLLRKLAELGYRRPGLALTTDTDQRTQYHYSSVFAAFTRNVPPEQQVPLLIADELTEATFGAWFERHRPDVVIAQQPPAPTVVEWLQRCGARVPQDVGFAALDVDPTLPLAASGIRQDYERVAAAAVELVISEVRCSERGIPASPKVVLIEGQWVDGETTRRGDAR